MIFNVLLTKFREINVDRFYALEIDLTKNACIKMFEYIAHIVEKWKIYSHRNFFPSNQLFNDLFGKCVAFTKSLPKKRESKFP